MAAVKNQPPQLAIEQMAKILDELKDEVNLLKKVIQMLVEQRPNTLTRSSYVSKCDECGGTRFILHLNPKSGKHEQHKCKICDGVGYVMNQDDY